MKDFRQRCRTNIYNNMKEVQMKKTASRRTTSIPIRFSQEEKQLVAESAARQRDYLSTYLRKAILSLALKDRRA